jgi:hypothetical protein
MVPAMEQPGHWPWNGLRLTFRSVRLRKNSARSLRTGLRSLTRKHVLAGGDRGAKPRQRPRLARQRPQSSPGFGPKLRKTRDFSALTRTGRFGKSGWWTKSESNRRPLVRTPKSQRTCSSPLARSTSSHSNPRSSEARSPVSRLCAGPPKRPPRPPPPVWRPV